MNSTFVTNANIFLIFICYHIIQSRYKNNVNAEKFFSRSLKTIISLLCKKHLRFFCMKFILKYLYLNIFPHEFIGFLSILCFLENDCKQPISVVN